MAAKKKQSRREMKERRAHHGERLVREGAGHHHDPQKFPKDFLWGASTAAHQVEGNNIHNDWWVWEQQKGHVVNNDRSGAAADSYNRYEEDFDLAQRFNHNSHRLSIEWSRIESEEGRWNMDEVEHYREVLQAVRDRGMKVMLTLHHFTNPVWLSEKGGWENSKTPLYFERFAGFIAEELGDLVDFWVTINEPLVYIAQSYIAGEWPPQQKSWYRAVRIFFRLMKGHKRAYRAIHKARSGDKRRPEVGIAKNQSSLASYSNSFLDWLYIRTSQLVWNELFFQLTKKYHDFIGVNYYFHQRIRRKKGGGIIFVDVRKDEGRDASDIGWEIYAPGLFDVLFDLSRFGKPIYITENGIAAVNDDKRIRFIITHLLEVYHAIEAGVDVRGYFHWSLIDNFEWEKGFDPRFGLVEIDYKTMERKPRASATVYGHIAGENQIEHHLKKFLGHGISIEEVCVHCDAKDA